MQKVSEFAEENPNAAAGTGWDGDRVVTAEEKQQAEEKLIDEARQKLIDEEYTEMCQKFGNTQKFL